MTDSFGKANFKLDKLNIVQGHKKEKRNGSINSKFKFKHKQLAKIPIFLPVVSYMCKKLNK